MQLYMIFKINKKTKKYKLISFHEDKKEAIEAFNLIQVALVKNPYWFELLSTGVIKTLATKYQESL